ncbi:hypothetical protein ACFQET_06490 [Levilactobacillus tangyuanensis]|uniref:Uncharacterized protein n=1 Tax=Levilactobacillus tangyuanensis TaxID=2486021 RepID=A0ABW1TMY0_9LACO|nr:hypothetical protein [Levilactobacillus tangyuanensis]
MPTIAIMVASLEPKAARDDAVSMFLAGDLGQLRTWVMVETGGSERGFTMPLKTRESQRGFKGCPTASSLAAVGGPK